MSRNFTCKSCNAAFFTRIGLNHHLEEEHNVVNPLVVANRQAEMDFKLLDLAKKQDSCSHEGFHGTTCGDCGQCLCGCIGIMKQRLQELNKETEREKEMDVDEDVFGQSNCREQHADRYTEDNQPSKEEIEASKVAVRADTGKDPWALFMWDAAREVVRVLKMGADKYTARNWEKGMDWSRCYDSAQRHLYAWFQEREDHDKESGLLHLGHAAWNIMVLLSYQIRGVGKDDRPRVKYKD